MSGARDRGPHREHLRQVRVVEPGREAADGRLPRDARRALGRAAPESVLDVGCGEGVLDRRVGRAARRRAGRRHRPRRPQAARGVGARERPNLEFRAEEATRLSFADDEFDLRRAIEVLEHVPEPEATVAEMARVARRHLLVSVPREPLWRALNMARGAYWRELGNTPGHVNHWSKRGVRSTALAPRDGRGGPLAVPVDHAACPTRTARAPGARRSARLAGDRVEVRRFFRLGSASPA